MGGIPVAAWVLLALGLLLSIGCVAVCAFALRTVWVLRADVRRRESELWKLDQEAGFDALARRFTSLSEDVHADMESATRERTNAQATNARAGKKHHEAQRVIDAGPRTKDQVRTDRLRGLSVVAGE